MQSWRLLILVGLDKAQKLSCLKKILVKNLHLILLQLQLALGLMRLHLSYMLAGLKPGDEVIAPVFTCTATNIPFLYMGVKIKFADIDVRYYEYRY